MRQLHFVGLTGRTKIEEKKIILGKQYNSKITLLQSAIIDATERVHELLDGICSLSEFETNPLVFDFGRL